jgi:DNA polymerase I-like protein with 3'-5' exonuclease and polymerase domains
MVLQMHDELVFEVDEADAADAVRAIRPMMARAGEAFGLRVPTPARVCVGPDWGSLEEVFY